MQHVIHNIQYSMNRNWIKLYLLFTVIPCCNNSFMQAQELSNYDNLTVEAYANLTLPPLDVLFENAKNAPSYELAEVRELIERKNLNKEKKAFLGFFSIRSSYQYGTFTNDGSYTDVYTQPFATYNKMKQNLWSIGGAVNIPLDQLFDLGGRVKRQKLAIREHELLKEYRMEEVKKDIIILYNQAIAQLNILKLRAESLVLANADYAIIERHFTNGSATSLDLATIKEKQSVAKEKYETTKSELSKSLMILELITQTPIIRQ